MRKGPYKRHQISYYQPQAEVNGAGEPAPSNHVADGIKAHEEFGGKCSCTYVGGWSSGRLQLDGVGDE